MKKYGKLLIEGIASAELFSVVSVPRSNLQTIVTQLSEPITDGTGQTEAIPLRWANYLIVEADDWQQEHTDAIMDAVQEYNDKYPEFPISQNEVLIWEN